LIKKITIGRKDKADFPEYKLLGIDIKMDTGAYTSAIHCHEIKIKNIKGKDCLTFVPLDPSHPQYKGKDIHVENYREKVIKNSFGGAEKRYIVETNILLFGKKSKIELSLSKRGEMKFPVLIGRKFLMGKYLVDSSKYNLSYKRSLKKSTD